MGMGDGVSTIVAAGIGTSGWNHLDELKKKIKKLKENKEQNKHAVGNM
jgi:uncharacterized pyridoxal phosphate-containing UPF0001 family protein